MWNLLVVEDEAAQRQALCAFLQQHYGGAARVDSFASVETFHAAQGLPRPDIAVLDIEIGAESGIELARHLNQTAPDCQIIYLTGHLQYAVEVYETRHVYYVTKDLLEHTLPRALEKAQAMLQKLRGQTLMLHQKDQQVVLRQDDILYMERTGRTTRIFCREEELATGEDFATLQNRLDELSFARCHRSFVVNLRAVAKLRRTEAVLQNGQAVPVGRLYTQALRGQFAAFIGSEM